jgi:hypothetical protein
VNKKIIKRILVVTVILGCAVVAGTISDWVMERKPPPPRAVPAGASLVEGSPVPAGRPKTVALSFRTLKNWNYVEKQKTPIPDFIRKFEGQTVEMTGYMMPLRDIKDIKSFVLVPALFGCCYGQPPAVNHIVLVKLNGGATVKFFNDMIVVRGQFHCGEEKEDGCLVSLYRLDADQVVAK